jgi:hypothetical protein
LPPVTWQKGFEAFVGQVFAITLVARLVSLWGQPVDVTSE